VQTGKVLYASDKTQNPNKNGSRCTWHSGTAASASRQAVFKTSNVTVL